MTGIYVLEELVDGAWVPSQPESEFYGSISLVAAFLKEDHADKLLVMAEELTGKVLRVVEYRRYEHRAN